MTREKAFILLVTAALKLIDEPTVVAHPTETAKAKKRGRGPARPKPLAPITPGMEEVPELDLTAAFDFLGATHVRTPPPQEPPKDKVAEGKGYAPSRDNDPEGKSDSLPWMRSPS